MRKIVVNNNALLFLDELVTLLIENGYFGFLESSLDYVNGIYDFILHDLASAVHYNTPKELKQYGRFYSKVKISKRTTWYVFFDKIDNRYLVEYITNNHTPNAQFINLL